MMSPVAVDSPSPAPPVGLESSTTKLSCASGVASPATSTVTVWLVSPGRKLTVPVGSTLSRYMPVNAFAS